MPSNKIGILRPRGRKNEQADVSGQCKSRTATNPARTAKRTNDSPNYCTDERQDATHANEDGNDSGGQQRHAEALLLVLFIRHLASAPEAHVKHVSNTHGDFRP